jgi:hypothetical protein
MISTYEGIIRKGRIHLIKDRALPEGSRVLVVVLPFTDEHFARRKANRWLAEYVGDMVMADQPMLTQVNDRQVWRFGAYVTSLHREPFGPVGYVDIDAETGAILADETIAGEIAQRGEHLECATLSSRN